jgi:branched-chain amino acid aminotransferase
MDERGAPWAWRVRFPHLQAATRIHHPAMTRLWCNGLWLDVLDFPTSPTDRGLMHGLGLFETILAVDGRPIFVDLHLARLQAGCQRLGWQVGWPDLKEIIAELINLNHLTNGRARIRLSITGGSGLLQDLSLGADHIVWLTAVPAADAPAATCANLAPWPRNERSPLAGLKCASYAENLIALEHAARLGFEETIFLNTAGHLCEAATANLFLVTNGRIATPSLESGCLPGITRFVVMDLAARLGIPCEERTLTRADLDDVDELFLTSTIRGVMGVSKFRDRTFPQGAITSTLREAWTEATQRKTTA